MFLPPGGLQTARAYTPREPAHKRLRLQPTDKRLRLQPTTKGFDYSRQRKASTSLQPRTTATEGPDYSHTPTKGSDYSHLRKALTTATGKLAKGFNYSHTKPTFDGETITPEASSPDNFSQGEILQNFRQVITETETDQGNDLATGVCTKAAEKPGRIKTATKPSPAPSTSMKEQAAMPAPGGEISSVLNLLPRRQRMNQTQLMMSLDELL